MCGFGLEVLGFFKAEISFSRTEGKNCIYLATSNFPSEGHFFFSVAFLPKTVFRVKSFLMATWW